MVAASQKAATTSTLGLGTALKGLGIKLKSLATAHPVLLAITAAITAIGAAFKVMEYEGKALERQQEKLDDALSAYENVKSELDSINSELDENKKKISELEAKPKLTYAEKGQLEELKQITEQLELQKETTEWLTGKKQKDAAMEAVEYVNTKYNLGDSNAKDVDELIPNILSSDHRSLDIAEDIDVTDAEYLAAAYKSASNELSGLINKRKGLSDDSPEAVFVDNDIEAYKSSVEDTRTEINDMLLSLMEQKANMQDYYDTIKDTPYEEMSTDARNCYNTMQQINASIQTLYYGLGNNRFNNEIINGIFNTEGIELTKENLVEMAQAGTLTPMVIASHKNLADAILNSNLVADEGCGLFETLCNEIYALAEADEKAAQSMSKAFSKSAMIDSVNALSDGFDIIDKIYADVKDKDVFDFANLDSAKFQEVFGELGMEYENFIEKVSESPNDINACQQAFNELISRYLESSGVLDNLSDENAQVTASMLELMGVANAQELVNNALLRKKAELITATDAYKNATDEEKQAMLEEIGTGEAVEQIIDQIKLQKQLANANALDTTADISKIYSLAQTAGFGAEALYNLAEARAFLMEAEAGGDIDQINEAKEAIRRIVSVEQQRLASFTADLQYTGADTNKKPGSSSKSETDTRLEEYRQKLEDLQTMLDRELINEKDFYDQSDALLNDYLKDTPAHMQKYADEISNAEKTLRGNWISSFGYEKAQLEKGLSDSTLVRWQYYEQLSELAEKYYNTEGASYGKFADEYEEITQEIKEGQEKLWDDIFSEVNSQLDSLQSACETVRDAVAEYSENGSLSIDTMQKLIALEPQYMAMLFDENGQLQLNAEAYERLAKTKLEEMKVDLASQTLNTINCLETEAQAVDLLTGKYAELRDTSLEDIETTLQAAVEEAHKRGEKQGHAADMMFEVYQNQKKVIDMTDFSLLSLADDDSGKEEKKFLKTFDWIGTLLEKISGKTSKLIDRVDQFHSWQKKNSLINRAVKTTDKEIAQNERAYQAYMKKANAAGLGLNYVRKVQNGTLSIEDITDETLSDKIDEYQEWYDKAQSCLDTIEDLYDKQRGLIRQKLDNVLDYYSDMDSYLSSITSKIESVISLNDEMGKRSSLTELVEQFAGVSGRIENATAKNAAGASVMKDSPGNVETADKSVEGDRQDPAASIQSGLENTATYQSLKRKIETTQSSIAEFDEKGYDSLTKNQKKTYDKMQKQLEDYYAQKKSLDEGATASNIAEYNKTYLAWKKLQDKIDSKKSLSTNERKKYNEYRKQLDSYADEKAGMVSELNDALAAAQNPSDKLGQIGKTYEESSKDLHDSYQNQIDSINGKTEGTQQYQNLLAKAQNLEAKKADKKKKFTASDQANLDKYSAELEALRTGATGANIKDYMKTWESWYTLEQKLKKNNKLSDSDSKKYDEYKAQIEAWNSEKQTQINDLLSLMEDDLEQLDKTYAENVSEAESEINDYYANLYSLAKQIAEYNISTLQAQLDYLDAYISYYKELVSLYDSFDGDKLVKILKDLGEINADDEISSRLDLYTGYLDKLQEKYNTTLSEINEYNQLLGALDTSDFESSMELFNKAMETYRSEGNTKMAENLQSVLDLLNERAVDAGNWGEFADGWKNEWEEALSSVKQDLIGTAAEIQEVNDALREIRFENITNAIEELERASGILSSIENLIKDEWLFEPDGTLSEYGRAKAALLVSQLEDAQSKANAYLKLYSEIQNNKDTYASDKAYEADLNDALQNYYDSLGSAASLENSIMDLMKKNAEEEVDSLKDIIEARKKALQAKKEYYDYDKSIRNSQKEIDSLKAQIDALEGLSDAADAATKAKLAQLKAELAQKEDALQETKDEHTFNLQINALDEFSETLTDALDESAKSVEEILTEQKEIVSSAKELYQASSSSVNETLKKLTALLADQGIMPETILTAFPWENIIMPQINDGTEQLNGFIRTREETQPIVINNHYDSLINVEGNVDKAVADLLPKQLQQSYEYTTQHLCNDIHLIGGIKCTPNTILT